MKLHIHVAGVDEIVEVASAEEALRRTKEEAAKRAPFLKKAVISAMSEKTFASEAVKMHNNQKGLNDPLPETAQDFLDWGVKHGYVSVME